MSRLFSLVGLFFMLVGCGEKRQRAVPPEGETSTTQGREQVPTGEASAFPIYDFESFEPLLHQGDGKIHIINFWATWCKPCLEEMPHFERIHAEYRDKGVVVVLVSLDMPNMWKSRLEPYVERKGIKSR